MATISLRKGFRWLDTPAPISETTTTTVLSSPNRLFVDVRIFNSPPSTLTSDTTTYSDQPISHPNSNANHQPITNPLLLDWAIAGTSSSTPTGPQTSHATFHHWISSRPLTTDEGDMDPHPDHPGLVRELGCMLNPETGKNTPYEEIWDDRTQEADTPCLVLRYEDEKSGDKGLCILIGDICQAVARTKEGIQVEKWERGKQVVRMGSMRTPCEEVLKGKVERKVGAVWTDGGREWNVVEV